MLGSNVSMLIGLHVPFNFETITVTTAVKGLTAATYTSGGNTARRVIITVENAQIRYRYDGTDPTATVGHLLNPMDALTLIGTAAVKNFRVIQKGTTNGKISVTYEI